MAPTGAFCPSVEVPGIDVPRDAATELIAIAEEPERVSIVSSCARGANLGFLMLDDQKRPVAEILVDSHCGRLSTHPRRRLDESLGDGTLGPARRARLRALLERLDLANPCDDAVEHRTAKGTEQLPPFVTGIDGKRSFDSLSAGEWKQLCAWHVLRWGHTGFGLTCPDGWSATVQGFDSCMAHPPACSATVGEVEACLRELNRETGSDACFDRTSTRHCRALRSCFWGYAPGAP